MKSYEEGFRDALDLMEHYLRKRGLLRREVKEILDDLRAAVVDKKIEKIKLELGLL